MHCPGRLGDGVVRLMAALLAFDTSTEKLHVGLLVGDRIWVHEGAGGATASAALIPQLLRLCADAGIRLHELDAIAFGSGPGAFTGLRTACSVAQGLAFGASKPALPIDTLMAVAEDARERAAAQDIWVAMDARMDEIYAGHFRWVDGAWRTATAPALHTPTSLNAQWKVHPAVCIAGSAVNAFGERLRPGTTSIVVDARPSARALLNCARAAWSRGSAIEASLALPCYLRDRVALTTAERVVARAVAFTAKA